jgi:hypothetical protein
MTVLSNNSKTSYPFSTLDNKVTVNITFPFLDNDSNLYVFIRFSDGTYEDWTGKPDKYSISLADGLNGVFGILKVNASVNTPGTLWIIRNIPVTQETPLDSNTVFANTTERMMDKLTMLIQDNIDDTNFIRVPPDEIHAPADLMLGSAQERANKFIAFDNTGMHVLVDSDIDNVTKAIRQPFYEPNNDTFIIAPDKRRGKILAFKNNISADVEFINVPAPTPPYELPIATDAVLGGVKQGANVTIDPVTGAISAPAPTPPYELPIATDKVLGGVKVNPAYGIGIDDMGNLNLTNSDNQRLVVGGSGIDVKYTSQLNWNIDTIGSGGVFHDLNNGNGNLLVCGANGVIKSTPLDESPTDWVDNSYATTNILNKIGYQSGSYLATGDASTIIYAGSLGSWQPSTLPAGIPSYNYYDFTYYAGRVVVVGGIKNTSGVILVGYSNDTINKQATFSSGMKAEAFRGICFTEELGLFIAVGDNGKIAFNPVFNAEYVNWNWSPSAGENLNSVAATNSMAVAVGEGGEIYTIVPSQMIAGAAWANRNSGTTENLTRVYSVSGGFIAFGENGTIITSPDGINWTQRQGQTRERLIGFSIGNTGTAIKGLCLSDKGQLLSSGDLFAWNTQATTGLVDYKDYNSVTFGERYVAVGAGGLIASSTDSNTWTITNDVVDFNKIRYLSNTYIILGNTRCLVCNTPDDVHIIASLEGIIDYYDIASLNVNDTVSYFIVGSSGAIFTAQDLYPNTQWTQLTSGVTYDLRGIVTTPSGLVVVGSSGTILTSSDGQTWTQSTSPITDNLNAVEYGNGILVAVGANGQKIKSSDYGATWSVITKLTTSNLTDISFGMGGFVVVGSGGVISRSDATATTWDNRSASLETQADLNGVQIYGNQFIVTGNDSTIAFGYEQPVIEISLASENKAARF